MSRARLIALAALGAAALAATGVAAASHRTQTTQQAAATFDAGSVSHEKTTTCIAGDGTYENTTATYTGTAGSSDARLSGSLQIRAHSVLNTSTGLGWVEGSFRVRGNDAGAHGTFHAAIAGGNAVGAIAGTVNRPTGKLVASFVSRYSPGDGFSSGKVGSGTTNVTSAGTIFSHGACVKAKSHTLTAVFALRLTSGQAVPPTKGLKARASGRLTLDVARDSNGTITGATAVFDVNYRFPGSVTITGLGLYAGAKGTSASASDIDAGTGSFTDGDGHGNVTKTAAISGALAQDLLAHPRNYYIQLNTDSGALRDQLHRPARRY